MDDPYGNYLFPTKEDQGPAVHQQSGLLRTCTPQTQNQQPEKKTGKRISCDNNQKYLRHKLLS